MTPYPSHCELCDARIGSAKQWREHAAGRRHRERTARGVSRASSQWNLIAGSDTPDESERDVTLSNEISALCVPAPSREVLLYYKYVDVAAVDDLCAWQRKLCSELKLRGRIHIGREGLNGTVGGDARATSLYCTAMVRHARWGALFEDMPFKRSSAPPAPAPRSFPGLFVRVCEEIIALGIPPSELSWRDSSAHLTPREFHALLLAHRRRGGGSGDGGGDASDGGAACYDGLVLLDVRNHFESEIGRFDGAMRAPTRTFEGFPRFADEIIARFALARGRRTASVGGEVPAAAVAARGPLPRAPKVAMYCTGGIRCERASAYLRSKGVNTIYQLKGGIHEYCRELGAGLPVASESLFRGRNFVFDRRLATPPVGGGTQPLIGRCRSCAAPADAFDVSVVCAACAALVLLCPACIASRARAGSGATTLRCALCSPTTAT